MLVFCGQTVGWITMPLSKEIGLDPGDIVLDGDPALPTERGTAAAPPPFDPCLLWINGRTHPSQQLLSFCFTLTSHTSAKSALAKVPFRLRTKTRVSVSVCSRYDRYAGVRSNGTHRQR